MRKEKGFVVGVDYRHRGIHLHNGLPARLRSCRFATQYRRLFRPVQLRQCCKRWGLSSRLPHALGVYVLRYDFRGWGLRRRLRHDFPDKLGRHRVPGAAQLRRISIRWRQSSWRPHPLGVYPLRDDPWGRRHAVRHDFQDKYGRYRVPGAAQLRHCSKRWVLSLRLPHALGVHALRDDPRQEALTTRA